MADPSRIPDSRTRPFLEDEEEDWSPQKSSRLYHIDGWGSPYFSVNEAGHVEVHPDGPSSSRRADLYDMVMALRARGLELPLLIRFPDVVRHRLERINAAFASAIEEYGYQGVYQGVYPVKVNQQRNLVEDIVEFGRPWKLGLEAGSKPELLIALAAIKEPGGLIICNGYKDRKYIETALLAQRLDKHVIVVLERPDEVDIVIEASRRLNLKPLLGVRAKLAAKSVGRWAKSAGDRAKFGYSSSDIVRLVQRLREADMLDSLKLLHFHIGSQISSIIPIKNALQEASNIYVELVKMGCAMGYLDIGGGLAIDYDGSKTDFHASRNYDLKEYAADVIAHVQSACQGAAVREPIIVSESGRAVAAHHSVLVFDVVDAQGVRLEEPEQPGEKDHRILQELYETWEGVAPKNVQEAWHDAVQGKEEAQSLFKYGYLSLTDRARAEQLYWHCLRKIQLSLQRVKFVPEELQDLEAALAWTYYCNFSVFQSAPDVWAIDQLFPIMPIHRLDERPTVRATLADLTCDSDGIIDKFIDVQDERTTLQVHTFQQDQKYILGMFLNGAYQEILGDLHNLFGDTNSVHVRMTATGYRVRHVIKGDSITDVLRYVGYDPKDMQENVRQHAEVATAEGRLTNQQFRTLMRHYETALNSYTYLGDEVEE